MASTGTFGWPTPDDTDFVRDGAGAIRALGDAVDLTLAGGYVYAGTRYFFSNGTFSKADPLLTGDIGLRAIRVRAVGGGGGSGGAATTGAGQVALGVSAPGGSYAESFITDIASLASSVSVIRGLGGTGGAAGANAGGNGGDSSFGALVVARGGGGQGGGVAFTPYRQSGSGGSAGNTGDLTVLGGESAAQNAVSATVIVGGAGGDSLLGSGGFGQATNAGVDGANGRAGQLYGGGASGAVNPENQGTARAGGNGGNGVVIVDCFV